MATIHVPVLKAEVMKALDPKPGEFFIDGTVGGGGHALALIEAVGPEGKLLGVDQDAHAIKHFEEVTLGMKTKIFSAYGNFADLPRLLAERGLGLADGLLLDLGLSSDEIEHSGRGFAFQKDEPLLMTLSDAQTPLKELLRSVKEDELATIIREYSDERYAKPIAKAIKEAVRRGGVETTFALRDSILRAVPKSYERGRIHPATRTFMALRMYANGEIKNIETVLRNIGAIVKPGGHVAVITFHSVEDRAVKHALQGLAKAKAITLINKKVIVPGHQEIRKNPRSRSAKLRSAVVLPVVRVAQGMQHDATPSASLTSSVFSLLRFFVGTRTLNPKP